MKAKRRQVKSRYNTPLLYMLFLLIPLYGGYYPFAFLFCGALLVVLILVESHRSSGIALPAGPDAYCLYLLAFCHLVSIPFAVSPGMAFTGFLRTLVFVLLFLSVCYYTTDEIELMLDAAAHEGAALSALYTVSFVANRVSGVPDLNGRIDGPFQYANTWALFQLICLILLACSKKKTRVTTAEIAALALGIGLTGSRGVLLLLLALMIFKGVSVFLTKEEVRSLVPILFFSLTALIVSGLLSGGLLWERLLRIPSSSSLNGRLLYWADGLRMLRKHPLGVGYGGYRYMQALEQTGVYRSRWIHNEYLQFALLAGIAFAALALVMLCRKGISPRRRIVMLVIAVHAMVDFDFQYFALVFLFFLCSASEHRKLLVFPRSRSRWIAAGLSGAVLCGCFLYFSTVYLLDFSGRAAWDLFPADLELAEKKLLRFPTAEDGEGMADFILRSTDLSTAAWDCKFQASRHRLRHSEMLDAKYHFLRLNRYQAEAYAEFADLFETAYRESGGGEHAAYRSLALAVIAQIEDVRENTSPLAYRIADSPGLEFIIPVQTRLKRILQEE